MKLSLTDVSKSYGGQVVIDRVSLNLEDVRSFVLIGPSGGGKSTLLRLLGGLETADSGEIEIDGMRIPTDENELIRYRRKIGTVFQSYNLFPHLSAIDNITLPLEKAHGFSRSAAREKAHALLRKFSLEAHGEKKPAELSGGQRQRVAIARALAIAPKFLLMDEPASALDPEMTAEVLETVEQVRSEGRDLVLVTHQMAFARRVADCAAFLSGGRIVELTPGDALFRSPKNEETRKFLSRILEY